MKEIEIGKTASRHPGFESAGIVKKIIKYGYGLSQDNHLTDIALPLVKNTIYTPGIISITGLLFILKFITLPAYIPLKYETVIKQTLLSEDPNKSYSRYQLIDQTIKKKKIIHISLTGNTLQDDKEVAFIQFKASCLKYTNDTTSILEIHFSNETSYGRFVELVNIMLEDGHKKYGLWKDNFYIIFTPANTIPSAPQGNDAIKPLYL